MENMHEIVHKSPRTHKQWRLLCRQTVYCTMKAHLSFAINEILGKLSLKGFYLSKCIIVKNES